MRSAGLWSRRRPFLTQAHCRLLDQHASVLDPELRQCLVKSLMIMSSKKIVTSHVLLPLCFKVRFVVA